MKNFMQATDLRADLLLWIVQELHTRFLCMFISLTFNQFLQQMFDQVSIIRFWYRRQTYYNMFSIPQFIDNQIKEYIAMILLNFILSIEFIKILSIVSIFRHTVSEIFELRRTLFLLVREHKQLHLNTNFFVISQSNKKMLFHVKNN